MSNTSKREKKLRQAFKAYDEDNDGKLYFKDFFKLLKKGNPDFLEREAEKLFKAADDDLSGDLDFEEFLDYIFDHPHKNLLGDAPQVETEEEAKKELLSYDLATRSAASNKAKATGLNWRQLSWQERLQFVRSMFDTESAKDPAPDQPTELKLTKSIKLTPGTAPSSPSSVPAPKPAPAPAPESDPLRPSSPMYDEVAKPGARAKLQTAQRKRYAETGDLADMTQEELVKHAISDEDLSFAMYDPEVQDLREYLKIAPDPLDVVDIIKFIAKGTAGWVFAATDKETGTKVAMKLIRMTQGRSGIKEWYVSKLLAQAGITKAVFTYETVRVIGKLEAPDVIAHELQNAGPVPYYMCMIQEFMPYGTLENLANSGKLETQVLFMALEDVASTLAAMHAARVQHKDVKPENIMMEMHEGRYIAAKLCDFGSAEVGSSPAARADDIRRFGVTLFSVATREEWTKRRLIREKHDNLVERMTEAVKDSSNNAIRQLPSVLEEILGGSLQMKGIAAKMSELRKEC